MPTLRGARALLVGIAICGWLTSGCGSSPGTQARRQLEARGVEPTDEAFLNAVAHGDRETVELLLEMGIRPAASLLRAVRTGHCELLPDLLAGGVVADAVAGARAVLQARRQGLEECVWALEAAGARQDARTDAGENLLTLAVEAGRTRLVREMLESGFPVDASNSRGETGLLVAARNGNEGLLELLLRYGADADARDVDGWSALAWAARQGLEGPVRRLLAAGVELDARDLAGWTPLLWASRLGHSKAAALLLEAGADADACSPAARTPLVWAASRGDGKLLDLLLAGGAEPDLEFDGVSPAGWAELHGRAETATRLRALEEAS
jgi:hypothetical protein